MSIETDVFETLSGVCPRVFPDFAPTETQRPFVTWSIIGGRPIRPIGKDVPNRRHAMIQINVWASTRIEANEMMVDIDAAMRQATAFDSLPNGELMTVFDEQSTLRGAIQDFDVYGFR